MAIADLDDAVNKCSGGNNGNPQPFFLYKYDLLDGAVAPGTPNNNRYTSLWQMVGVPAHGSAPGGTARNPTGATAGAIGQADATGGRTLYVTSLAAVPELGLSQLNLADRLADISGFVGNVNTVQTVTGLSVTRYTGAESVGNQIWIEIYTAIGASLTTIKASYTNQAGVAGQITPLVGIGSTGLQEAQTLIRLPLVGGDTGVRSVESIQLTATTGTAGDIGVTIMRTIAEVPCNAARSTVARNYLGPDFPPVPVKAGAALFIYGGTNIATPMTYHTQFIEA